jgi:hypothetical protein
LQVATVIAISMEEKEHRKQYVQVIAGEITAVTL